MATNQKEQCCTLCGILVPPGAGRLEHYSEDYLEDMDMFDLTPGWHVFCLDVEGCRERVARWRRELDDARAARAAYEAAKQRLFAPQDGEYPQGPGGGKVRIPKGVQVRDGAGFNIYGSGSEWVIEPDEAHVWYVYQNGMDGDDWSRSNTNLGIGRRYPFTPERRAFLDPMRPATLDHAEAVRRIAAATGLDPALFPAAEAEPVPQPMAAWTGGDLAAEPPTPLLGKSLDNQWVYSRCHLRAAHGDDPKGDTHRTFMDLGIPSSNNVSHYYLRWPATPERRALVDAHLPAWVGTTLPGRYLVGESGPASVADNAADALEAAALWTVPAEKVQVTPDVTLVHVDTAILIWSDGRISPLSTGLGLKLFHRGRDQREHDRWDRERVARGEKPLAWNMLAPKPGWPPFPPAPAEDPRLLTEASSRLLRLAIRARVNGVCPWEGRLREFFDVSAIVSETTVDQWENQGASSGAWWKLVRVVARWQDGSERALFIGTAGEWSMGEDGDASDWSMLFESEAAARAAVETQP